MKFCLCYRWLAICWAVLTTVAAQAAPIPGLFNTGVNSNRALLPAGALDSHYKLVQSPDVTVPGPNTFVVNEGFPIPPWLANGPASKWIGPMAAQGTGNQPGNYTYRLLFNLAGLDPATAVITGRWSSDNTGPDVLLNGVSTGVTGDGNFGVLGPPFTLNSGFVDGTNTLDFVVNNAAPGINPTGFRAELSGTAEPLVPPGTPPSITLQPTNLTVADGNGAVFSVNAIGSRPLSYQWRFQSHPMPGATNTDFAIACVTSEDAGAYDVVVTNAFGAVTSVAATLSVISVAVNPSPAELTYEPLGPSSRRTGLTFSEVMYHPTNRADGRNLEFIELFNSNPFPEDISGWRLTGSVDYTFPSNTTIASNGFIVIATAPADVQAVYGLASVTGGFTNTLPNDEGTLRLRKRSGAIVLEMNYSDQPPWPAAADGTGHSLVLARASHGENNPRAWAASAVKGGSPGARDATPIGPIENVVINEILAHTTPPLPDFVELYNHSAVAVDLSGCWLSDDPATNKFRIPDGTLLPAGGCVAFTENQLLFALSANGETLFLVHSNQARVIDAVRFGGQARDVSYGRYPDGAAEFYALTNRTPGTNNAAPLLSDVVINEIMFNPLSGLSDDQYVELYNRGAQTVNVGGWRFLAGISFVLPPDTLIPADGYLVVAKNVARVVTNYPGLSSARVVGDFGGALAQSGERLALARPEIVLQTNSTNFAVSSNTFFVVVDEVTYGEGGRWGRWADGGGSSLELIDPRGNHRLAPSWADSDETAKAAWTIVTNTGVLDLPHPTVTSADQLQVFLQGPGEALVDDVEVRVANVNRVTNPSFESGVNGWFFQGTQSKSFWETNEGYSSARSLHLVASERGDHVANRVRTVLSSPIPTGTTNVSIRAKVRWLRGHPEVLFRLRGGGLEAVGRLAVPTHPGTPGARNSVARANAGPAITEVKHRPVLPAALQSIRITARVDDPDGRPSVVLRYRVDPATSLVSVPMTDDGLGCDVVAGDGIFSGAIPGQANGRLIAFRVEATDEFNPPATTQFPSEVPRRECLVRVGETMPPGQFGVYRFWFTAASQSFWSNREKMSNEDVDTTFVYGAHRVVYNGGAHYSGSSYTAPGYNGPTANLCGYDLNFPPDDAVLGETHFTFDWNIRDATDQREQLMYWLLDQFGLPNMYRRYVHLIVNGVPQTARGGWGLPGSIYDDVQQPGGDTLQEWFSDDNDGALYKTDCWNEFDDAGNRIDPCLLNSLENFTTSGGVKKTARYRWNWRPRALHGTANDYASLFTLVDTLIAQGTGYVPLVEDVVDVDHWTRTFAMNDLASFWDAFGNPNAKNTYLYKPERDRWKLFCWDFDVGLGVFNDPTSDPLFPALGDSTMNRFQATPAFVRCYWSALQEAVNSFFQVSAVMPILSAMYAAFQGSGINLVSPFVPSGAYGLSITSWITQRRNFLLTQLNTVAASFAITSNSGNDFSTDRNFVVFTGTAPVSVKTIRVNGLTCAPTWTSVTQWSLRLALASGTNTLTLEGLDRFGNVVAGGTDSIRIHYTGTPARPEESLVINELMYHPAAPDTEFVEIYNLSPTTAFDLAGYRLNGLDFTFAPCTVIAPTGFVVVAKNRLAFGKAFGFGIPVAGEFEGSFDRGGETISLIQPGFPPAPDQLIDAVTYDDDPPWPAAADGTGLSLQLIDPAQDNARVANWSVSADWRFMKFTGVPGASRLFIFMDGPGDAYLDDISLVEGTVANVGSNYMQNGDFEAPLTGPWHPTGNHSNSVITSAVRYDGSSSLHVIASGVGGVTAAVYQDLPPVITNLNCTLSFWMLPGASGTNITFRFSTPFRPQFSARPVRATPGTNNSVAATLPAFPLLWLNEVEPQNVSGIRDGQGEREPWIEIYNADTNPVFLDDFFLADNFTNLTQWAFPPGRSLQPGEIKIIWADGELSESTPTEWHTNFRLAPTHGSLALTRSTPGQDILIDYLNYEGVEPDHSFGSFPDGNPHNRTPFSSPTPGVTNSPSAVPVTVRINEWMAANAGFLVDTNDGQFDDWFELYNPDSNTVSLAGFKLTDALSESNKFIVPAGITIPPHGFLLVWADEDSGQTRSNGDLHVNFKLNQDGEAIALFDPAGRLLDSVTFGAQTNNVSQGRWPDGSAGPPYFMPTATPRAPNIISGPPDVYILAIELTAGPSVTLTWTTVPGRIYHVQYKNDLSAALWEDLPGEVIATGLTASKTDAFAAGTAQRFYRVRLLP